MSMTPLRVRPALLKDMEFMQLSTSLNYS